MDGAVQPPEGKEAADKVEFEDVVDFGGPGTGRRSRPWKVVVQQTTSIDMRCMSEMAAFCEEVRLRPLAVQPPQCAILSRVWLCPWTASQEAACS